MTVMVNEKYYMQFRIVFLISIILLSISFVIQCLISTDWTNFFTALIAYFVSFSVCYYLFGPYLSLSKRPISALILIGVLVSTTGGALLFQSLSFTPISYNLRKPIETFFFVGVLNIVLMISHYIYMSSFFAVRLKNTIVEGLFKKIGLFLYPTNLQLWFMGFLGAFSVWYTATSDIVYGDVSGKFIFALSPLTYSPLLIPFINKLNGDNTSKKDFIFITIFFVSLVLIGVVRNSRGVFVTGAFNIIFVWLIMFVFGFYTFKKKFFLYVMILFPFLFVLISAISDLAIAMVLARSQREDVKGIDLLLLTLQYLIDHNEVIAYKMGLNNVFYNEYNEIYISNPLGARLVTIKFDDNMFFYGDILSLNDASRVAQITMEKIIALIPTPILNIIGYDLNKENIQYSMGDYIYYLSSNSGLGGFKLGSITVHGLILFGPLFFIVFVPVLSFFVYSISDSFYFFDKYERTVVSPIFLLMIFSFYSVFNGDSLINIITFFVRTLPQIVFIYIFISFCFNLFYVRKCSF